jgi:hypothetical protein
MPGVFPDYPGPVIRNTETGSELAMMRWGMPPPPKIGGAPVTNIRNTSSPHWRGWLKPENRYLVPANSFAEYAPEQNPETKKKDVVWFALNEYRPLFAFGGMWTTFNGDRGTKLWRDRSPPRCQPHPSFRIQAQGITRGPFRVGANCRLRLTSYPLSRPPALVCSSLGVLRPLCF